MSTAGAAAAASASTPAGSVGPVASASTPAGSVGPVASASTPARPLSPFRRIRCYWHPTREIATCPPYGSGDSALVRCANSQGWSRKKNGRSSASHWRCPQCTADSWSPQYPPQRPAEPESCCVENHGGLNTAWWAEQCQRCGIEAWASASTPAGPVGPVASASTPVPAPSEADRATEERFGSFQQQLDRLTLRVAVTENRQQEQLDRLIDLVAALETENSKLNEQVSWLRGQVWRASWRESGWDDAQWSGARAAQRQ